MEDFLVLWLAFNNHFLVVDLHPSWCGGVDIMK